MKCVAVGMFVCVSTEASLSPSKRQGTSKISCLRKLAVPPARDSVSGLLALGVVMTLRTIIQGEQTPLQHSTINLKAKRII